MDKDCPKPFTDNEIQEAFLAQCWLIIDYALSKARGKSLQENLETCVFGLLGMLDGCSSELPPFIVAPNPAQSDRSYNIEHGHRWFPENYDVAISADIGGDLHDKFYRCQPIKMQEPGQAIPPRPVLTKGETEHENS